MIVDIDSWFEVPILTVESLIDDVLLWTNRWIRLPGVEILRLCFHSLFGITDFRGLSLDSVLNSWVCFEKESFKKAFKRTDS